MVMERATIIMRARVGDGTGDNGKAYNRATAKGEGRVEARIIGLSCRTLRVFFGIY